MSKRLEGASLEWQWQQYLKRAGVNEKDLMPVQRQEMKRAFIGACGQMLIFMRDDLTQLPDYAAAMTLQDLLNQVANFWTAEVNRNNLSNEKT